MSITHVIPQIGVFSCQETYTYDVPRQGSLAGANQGTIILEPGYENALFKLDSFSHIWVLFLFDRNKTWKPMIRPPRHTEQKVGLFASRSPYRPSGIGLSCVRLIAVDGLKIHVEGHDILDGSPILDIKPYLPYADSFPNASPGWTADNSEAQFQIDFSEKSLIQLAWLEAHGVSGIKAFIMDRLGTDPLNRRRNRLMPDSGPFHVLAYRTWRILFAVSSSVVSINSIRSGYSDVELCSEEDKYADKFLHRTFIKNLQD